MGLAQLLLDCAWDCSSSPVFQRAGNTTMSINSAQSAAHVKPSPGIRWRRWGSPSVARLQSSLVGLARYEWLQPGHRDRRQGQQMFFASLFVSLGSMLQERWQGGPATREFVASLQRALDLSPFHRDMADRLIEQGRHNPRLAEALLDRFIPLCHADPELAELFVEILCDACNVRKQDALAEGSLTEYMTARLGLAEEWLVVIERRVKLANEEKPVRLPEPEHARPGSGLSQTIDYLPILPFGFAT